MSDSLDDLRASLELRSTDELVSVLRNRDEDEWRPDVFEIVASILTSRGLSPSAVAALGPEGFDVVEGQPLATIARYFSPAEAHAARLALEGAGISAWVADESLGTVYGVGVGARLQVRAEDESAALALLDADPVSAEDLPADLAEPPCPSCGSSKVSQLAEFFERPPTSTAPTSGRRRRWRYDCGSCGHRWSDPDE